MVSYRLRITSLEEHGQTVSQHDTGVVQINLSQDEVMSIILRCYLVQLTLLIQESSLLALGLNVHYPLYVSVNMILTSVDSN